MRRVVLVLAAMASALLLASGVAWAVNEVGTNGPDTLRGTNRADNLLGRGGGDIIFGLGGRDNLLGERGKDIIFGGSERGRGRGDTNLAGGPGNDAVAGGNGSDNLLGGGGNDFLGDGGFRESSEDNLSGGGGNDVLDAINRPAFGDNVVCGRGFDRVLADRKDVVAPDCERVFVGVRSAEAFFESIPESFLRGLNPELFEVF